MNNFVSENWYVLVKDVVTLLFTVYGLYLAGRGLWTWRDQIKGTKGFEAAYNLNYSMLKLREAVRDFRHPAIWNPEFTRARQYAEEKGAVVEEEGSSDKYVYEMRWVKVSEAMIELESHMLAAEVLWGREILENVVPLKRKVNELRIAIEQYLNPRIRSMSREEIDDIIYNTGTTTEDDKFGESINESILTVKNFLRDKVKNKNRFLF